MSVKKETLLKSILIILVGLFWICPGSILLREDVPTRYDDVAPILTDGFVIVGIILIGIGLVHLILTLKNRMKP